MAMRAALRDFWVGPENCHQPANPRGSMPYVQVFPPLTASPRQRQVNDA